MAAASAEGTPAGGHKTASSLSLPPSQFAQLQPHTYLFAHLSPPDTSSRPSVRVNGRTKSQFRSASVNAGSLTHSNGSAVVRIGDTTAVCGVRAEILSTDDIAAWNLSTSETPPNKRRRTDDSTGGDKYGGTTTANEADSDSDFDYDDSEIQRFNLLVPNLSLNTGCSPSIPPGAAPTPLAQSLSHQLLALLHSSRLVRSDDLRIWYQPPNLSDEDTAMTTEEGEGSSNSGTAAEPEIKAYWTLYIDVLMISLAGNPFDAAWAAVIAALRDTRLPKAWWDMDREMVLCSDSAGDSQKLRLRGMPVSNSFCVFEADPVGDWRRLIAEESSEEKGKTSASKEEQNRNTKRWVLADPDAFEESLCQERACVVVDKNAQGGVKILKLEKNGGFHLGKEAIRELVGLAAERWEEWMAILGSPEV